MYAMQYNNMIPVTDKNIIKIDPASNPGYCFEQTRYIRTNHEQIQIKAQKVYAARSRGNNGLANEICCDFKKLERGCALFNEQTAALQKKQHDDLKASKGRSK